MENRHEGEVLTTGQVSRVLGIAPRTASALFDNGLLKGFRMDTRREKEGDRRILRSSLLGYIARLKSDEFAKAAIGRLVAIEKGV